MVHAVGLRLYRVSFHEEWQKPAFPLNDSRLVVNGLPIFEEFIRIHTDSVVNLEEAQRGWFFEDPDTSDPKDIKSLIQYGVHGFTSRFVDVKTREEKFQRDVTDMEEIPLYFRAWFPEGESFAIFAFQSFSGRSCIGHVQTGFTNFVKKQCKGATVRFRKLMPGESGMGPYANAIVKEVTFIKKRVSGDKADAYLDTSPESFDVKLSLSSRKKGGFGPFGKLNADKLRKAGGAVMLVDNFDEASAEVMIGGRRRKVGVWGTHGDAGAIDITEEVKNIGGHPTKKSLEEVTGEYLKYFYETMSEIKR